jgi:rhodanese-related sulfurtransferase
LQFAVKQKIIQVLFMIQILFPEDLKILIEQKKAHIIDVREQGEYAETNICGSVLIALSDENFLPKIMKNINENKDKKIVIHCRSGARSLTAAKMINKENNTIDVYNLEGGIMAWNKYCNSNQGEPTCSIKRGGCGVK